MFFLDKRNIIMTDIATILQSWKNILIKILQAGQCTARNSIINWILHGFWLVLGSHLLEGRRIDDVTINNFSFASLLYKTNRFHVAVRMSCGRSHQWHTWLRPVCHVLFILHMNVVCDLLLHKHTETWNLFDKISTGTVSLEETSEIVHRHALSWTYNNNDDDDDDENDNNDDESEEIKGTNN